mgnify:CR=1 FL=1
MHETLFLVLGLVGLLTIASLLLPLANRINFPYTVLLALAGSLLGGLVLALEGTQQPGLLGDFLHALQALDITSEVVFFVFLPALIFESALNINVRHLIADIGPILLLAILGLLISTVVVGLTLMQLSGMALVVCLLVGAIVSATDPIAVIAIFKSLGAPKRLTILVEGESLFNDATAIVVFTILAAILAGGGEASLLSASGRFLVVFFGGIGVGLVSAWLMASVIGRLRNLPLVEITLTICLAYLSFLLAEHYLHVSGVMAVVTAGLVINSVGRTQVSAETWHALTETWEQLVFWANSLIFFLVGLLVPKVLAGFTSHHAIALLGLIIAAFAARSLVLYGVLPSLHRLGLSQHISLPFRTVMLWGGLRGAVSLALALVILENPAIPDDVKVFVGTLVTGFVLFTLFVNAPTMGGMMRLFALDQLPPSEQAIRNRVMALSLSRVRNGLEQTAEMDMIDRQITSKVSDDYQQRLSGIEGGMAAAHDFTDDTVLQVGLTTLLNHERQLYLQRFSDGVDSAQITRLLLTRTDDLLDGMKANHVQGYQQALNRQLGFNRLLMLGLQLQRKFGNERLLAQQLANRFEVLRATHSALNRLVDYNRTRLPALLSESAVQSLATQLDDRRSKTHQALIALRLQYPDYAHTLQERHLSRVALRLEETEYRRMLGEQMISQEVFNDLVRDIDQRSRTLDQQPTLDLGLKPDKLVARVPFFSSLPEDQIQEIAQLLRPQLVVPGEQIISKGDTGDAMYFISSGAVEVTTPQQPVRLGSGDFFGEMTLLTRQPRNADITAIAYCQLLILNQVDFHPLLAQHPELQKCMTETIRDRLNPEQLIERLPLFESLPSDQLHQIAQQLSARMVIPGEQVIFKDSWGETLYFIASGCVQVTLEPEPVQLQQGDFFGELSLLTGKPCNADVTAVQYCLLLALSGDHFKQVIADYPVLKDQILQTANERLGVDISGLSK